MSKKEDTIQKTAIGLAFKVIKSLKDDDRINPVEGLELRNTANFIIDGLEELKVK